MGVTPASFGSWVRRRRLALDLTRDALARLVGCSSSTLKKIERDERRPSRTMATRLAEALGLPPDQRERSAVRANAARGPHGHADCWCNCSDSASLQGLRPRMHVARTTELLSVDYPAGEGTAMSTELEIPEAGPEQIHSLLRPDKDLIGATPFPWSEALWLGTHDETLGQISDTRDTQRLPAVGVADRRCRHRTARRDRLGVLPDRGVGDERCAG